MEPSEGDVMADPDSPLIAYPPIKLIIKLEKPDKQQEANSVEEENWLHQVYYFSLFLYICILYNTVTKITVIYELPFSSPKSQS